MEMGEKIKTAIEIAMEKAERLSDLSNKEKEKINIKKKVEPMLAKFFKNEIDPDGLWKKFKEEKKEILEQAQVSIINSLTMGLSSDELKRRKNAILALENLKNNPDAVYVEKYLNSLEDINSRAGKEREDFYAGLMQRVENNPDLRVRQINSGGKKMLVRLTAEEAVNQSKEWRDFISQHEKMYMREFRKALDMIKEELGIV
jgi:uncharacterized protein YlzI (FlbEa/FlbD family)